jgi:integrase
MIVQNRLQKSAVIQAKTGTRLAPGQEETMTDKRTPDAEIKRAKLGAFVTLQKIVPAGALQARKLKNGTIALYWRFTQDNITERVLLGHYDSKLPPKKQTPVAGGYSILGAARAAEAFAKRHADNLSAGGHRALEAADAADKVRAKAERIEASKQTLEALVLAYCDHLQSIGRNAHRDARSLFNLHLIEAWPDLAKTPAAQVTDEQVADALRLLFDAGKGRSANKLRAYLRAAYEVARRARTDPKVPVRFKSFNVRTNPAAATAAVAEENKPDKNPLSAKEMRTYWRIVKRTTGFKGAVLRLHLLTGGQRIEQLVRLRVVDIMGDTITIFDGKGRPGRPPRPHPLPLLPEAAAALRIAQMANTARRAKALSGAESVAPTPVYALSTDGGTTHIGSTTLSGWAAEAVGDRIVGFKAKRLRSGIETLLSNSGIGKDVRGRLQSHGISGVQATHYDAHDYLPEKRQALETLFALLTGEKAKNVVPMRAAA